MSFVIAVPEALQAAAKDVDRIGSTIGAAHVAAAASTTTVVAAAGDEVSTAIASVFSGHAQAFQALSAQAAVFHDQFAQALSGAGGSYALAEAANAASLQPLPVIAGAAAGTIGAVHTPVLNVVNSAAAQLVDASTSLLDTFSNTNISALFLILLGPVLIPFLALYLYEAYTGKITPF